MTHAHSKSIFNSRSRIGKFKAALWTGGYVAAISAINAAYVHLPALDLCGAHLPPAVLLAGAVFVLRDFVQRSIGHGVLFAMTAAAGLSYCLASPAVAAASAGAFAVAELVDYAIFTFWKGRLRDRILLSSLASVPIDTLLFFFAIGIVDALSIALGIGAKMIAAVAVWIALTLSSRNSDTMRREVKS